MANVTKTEINKLWKEMGDDRSWAHFEKVLKEDRNKEHRIDEDKVDQLIKVTGRMKRDQESFPSSPDKLHDVLAEQTKETEHTREHHTTDKERTRDKEHTSKEREHTRK
jgi:hypothetical protein